MRVPNSGSTSLRVEGTRDLLTLAAANPERYPCLLESVVAGAHGRHDILFAFPEQVLELGHDGHVRDRWGTVCGAQFLDALDDHWRRMSSVDPGAGFAGAWVLFLGYELAGEIEPRLRLPPPADPTIPVALALRCRAAIVVDRRDACTTIVVIPDRAELLDVIRADLGECAATERAVSAVAIEEDDPRRFLDGVARIREHLAAGDTFQVNLSREWRARFAEPPAPADLHASLRRANPAPFAGLLQWRHWSVISSSPERLVQVRDGVASTRPIAGTCARHVGVGEARRIRELRMHPKERAEHVMLIDLERNDLGRIAVPGSVEVDELMTVESYAHVHHLVSSVRARVRPGVAPGEIIRAMFPGGTITGCPKVRGMEIIAELEGVGRGPYTGALGYLCDNGDMDLNILIRTLSACGQDIRLRAGAGVVADSEPLRELDETRAKARGLLRALGVVE